MAVESVAEYAWNGWPNRHGFSGRMRAEYAVKNPQRHSKRKDLRGLPVDWREAIACRLKKGKSKYYLAFLTAAVTGCRPAELQTGVTVRVQDGLLLIAIDGAKVDAKKGQPQRGFAYDLEDAHPLVVELADAVQSGGGEKTIDITNARNFSTALRQVGQRLWPRRRSTITPYCLRHAAASDFKAAQHLSGDDVSRALGHAAAGTRKLYGQHQMSRGGRGVAPTGVEASRVLSRRKPKASRPGGP